MAVSMSTFSGVRVAAPKARVAKAVAVAPVASLQKVSAPPGLPRCFGRCSRAACKAGRWRGERFLARATQASLSGALWPL